MSLQPRTATVTIFQGDYLDEIEHLRKQVEALQESEKDSPPRTLGDPSPTPDLIARHDALVAEAEASAVHVKIRNLGRRSYSDLKAKHPPRTGEEGTQADRDADANLGCNQDTFFDELLLLSLVSITGLDEEPRTDTDRQRFLEDLAPIDWERIKWAAFRLNEVATADPKSLAGSKPTVPSDAI